MSQTVSKREQMLMLNVCTPGTTGVATPIVVLYRVSLAGDEPILRCPSG